DGVLATTVAARIDSGWIEVRGDAELRTPRNATDPEAWSRLDRRAIRSLSVDGRIADLARLGDRFPESPFESGELALTARIEDGGQLGRVSVVGREVRTIYDDRVVDAA